MRTETALRVALVLSGKYDTEHKATVHGRDQCGNPVQEETSLLDMAALERDLAMILAAAAIAENGT